MDINERIAKFDRFLTSYAEASGATELCEAVRSAMKVCFETAEVFKDGKAPWMDPGLIDSKYKGNVVAPSQEIHRNMINQLKSKALAKYRAKKAAEKAIPADDPVGTDAPKDECAEKAE
jgi:hypothetical protein